MKTVRNVNLLGMCLIWIVFSCSGINAWAVVPYPLSPAQINAEKVQAEKQEIITEIENLKKQDIKFVKEIRNELKQMDEKDSGSFAKDATCAERR
jgi:cytoplasmic iron level regulating protein YaaA (DUF328/UPF0246 family)